MKILFGSPLLKKTVSLGLIAGIAAAVALAGPAVSARASASTKQQITPMTAHRATAVLAGGCFWGMEEVFSSLRGVQDVTSGYSGGAAQTAHYETVELGTTGHAESIKITYDPTVISYSDLLRVYFTVAHDPTQVDRQAPDQGPQYRSEIFYANAAQRDAARRMIAQLTAAKKFNQPIATKIEPLKAFYPAEAYHQDFAARNPGNPYIVAVDAPRVAKLRQLYPQLLK